MKYQFTRSNKIQQKYNRLIYKVKKSWLTFSDYMINKLFDIEPQIKDGMKYIDKKQLNNINNLVITLNKFPYNFPKNHIHYILWKLNKKITSNEINYTVKKLLNKYKTTRYFLWINPYYKKSIKKIPHIHIVIIK